MSSAERGGESMAATERGFYSRDAEDGAKLLLVLDWVAEARERVVEDERIYRYRQESVQLGEVRKGDAHSAWKYDDRASRAWEQADHDSETKLENSIRGRVSFGVGGDWRSVPSLELFLPL